MEDQDDMCDTFRVRWTIIPQIAPQPWIACSGCGGLRAFQSSGKIRLNANGRRLDAWLIYKCLACEKTWNRPIFERQTVRDISPAVLDALQSNDPLALEALELFCGFLGSVAGNLALTLGARGGVFIGGGMVPRLGTWFDQSPFRARFESKGRFAPYLASIPCWVIDPSATPALYGASRALDIAGTGE